jgi:hypothetical protein
MAISEDFFEFSIILIYFFQNWEDVIDPPGVCVEEKKTSCADGKAVNTEPTP